MIFDRLENSRIYFPSASRMAAGMEFLRGAMAGELCDGRHEIDGENIFATVQSYVTTPAAEKYPESHRKYADIQALLTGVEVIGWLPVEGLSVRTPYSEERDILFYDNAGGGTSLVLKRDLFAVFYPGDAHTPGSCLDVPSVVRKIVVKVAL